MVNGLAPITMKSEQDTEPEQETVVVAALPSVLRPVQYESAPIVGSDDVLIRSVLRLVREELTFVRNVLSVSDELVVRMVAPKTGTLSAAETMNTKAMRSLLVNIRH